MIQDTPELLERWQVLIDNGVVVDVPDVSEIKTFSESETLGLYTVIMDDLRQHVPGMEEQFQARLARLMTESLSDFDTVASGALWAQLVKVANNPILWQRDAEYDTLEDWVASLSLRSGMSDIRSQMSDASFLSTQLIPFCKVNGIDYSAIERFPSKGRVVVAATRLILHRAYNRAQEEPDKRADILQEAKAEIEKWIERVKNEPYMKLRAMARNFTRSGGEFTSMTFYHKVDTDGKGTIYGTYTSPAQLESFIKATEHILNMQLWSTEKDSPAPLTYAAWVGQVDAVVRTLMRDGATVAINAAWDGKDNPLIATGSEDGVMGAQDILKRLGFNSTVSSKDSVWTLSISYTNTSEVIQ